MARILIIEDNHYNIFMIMRALEGDGHKVFVGPPRLSKYSIATAKGVDLTIINRFLDGNNGWEIFNRIKETDGKADVMLYVLENCDPVSLKWLRTSIREALRCKEKKGKTDTHRALNEGGRSSNKTPLEDGMMRSQTVCRYIEIKGSDFCIGK